MKSVCFMFMILLLSAVFASATRLAARNEANRIPSGMLKGLKGSLAGIGGLAASATPLSARNEANRIPAGMPKGLKGSLAGIGGLSASATPLSARNEANRIPYGMLKGLKGSLARIGGLWTAMSEKEPEMRIPLQDEGKVKPDKCVSAEHCKKHKKVCFKKCGKPLFDRIKKKQIPGKCVLKCKKCVPSC